MKTVVLFSSDLIIYSQFSASFKERGDVTLESVRDLALLNNFIGKNLSLFFDFRSLSDDELQLWLKSFTEIKERFSSRVAFGPHVAIQRIQVLRDSNVFTEVIARSKLNEVLRRV